MAWHTEGFTKAVIETDDGYHRAIYSPGFFERTDGDNIRVRYYHPRERTGPYQDDIVHIHHVTRCTVLN